MFGTLVLIATLAGCTASPTPTSSEIDETSVGVVTDVVTCEAFGDVSTIIGNADAALAEGRMDAQERDGWYRLATRVLDRVPTSGSGPVHDAVQQLREAAPAIKLGAAANVDFRSMKWADGKQALSEACAAQGVDLAVEAFTGG